jgi:urease accessory protein
MRSAKVILGKGSWDQKRSTSSVLLPYHDRYRRRIVLFDGDGNAFRLDLDKVALLHDGDGLLLDDGSVIAVHAAEEDVADISATNSRELARLAWHIGNRHTPLEILPNGQLRIHYDAVLVGMVLGLGGTVTRSKAPFSPERGAYDKGDGAAAHGVHHHHD